MSTGQGGDREARSQLGRAETHGDGGRTWSGRAGEAESQDRDWDVAFGVGWRSWVSWSEQFLWSKMTEDTATTSDAASSLPQLTLRTLRDGQQCGDTWIPTGDLVGPTGVRRALV